ncbi:hypothetical protein D3C85_1931670 [compost metagenome]
MFVVVLRIEQRVDFILLNRLAVIELMIEQVIVFRFVNIRLVVHHEFLQQRFWQ